MTTTENESNNSSNPFSGIYLLEMTTTENPQSMHLLNRKGIYLFEMTTTENYHIILISDDC